jgi:hypothetical protein
MCGRAKLETDVSEIKVAFRIPPEYPTPNFAPSWNVAPTDLPSPTATGPLRLLMAVSPLVGTYRSGFA